MTSPSPSSRCVLRPPRPTPPWSSPRSTTAASPACLKNAIDWLSRPFGNGALKDKPLAVVGAAAGQYGGVWAHDETRKSFGIAGPRVVEDLKLSVPAKAFDGKHPRENAEVAANLRDIVGKLAAEVA